MSVQSIPNKLKMYGQNMKKNETRDQRIEIRLSKTEKENIEKLAEKLELPASTLMRNLVLTSYEDAIIFEHLGVLKGIKKFREFKERFSSIINKDK